MEMFMDN